MLRRTFLAGLAGAAIALVGTVPAMANQWVLLGKQTVDSSSPNNQHMKYALYLINESRKQYGLNPVTLDTANGPCALRHAQDVNGCAGGDGA